MKKRNELFWKKSKPQQRVAIAKDVIAQLNAKFYKSRSGTYLQVRNLKGVIRDLPPQLDGVFSKIKERGATCDVCGIGSCFVSLVRLGNNFGTDKTNGAIEVANKNTIIDDDDMRVLLRKVFSPPQLSLIESAFEQTQMTDEDDDKSWQSHSILMAVAFGRRYKRDTDRLMAIMKNIIDNEGYFNP